MLAKSIQNGTEVFPRAPASTYERYKIATRHAPPRKKQPHPFTPKVRKIGLATMLLHEAFEYGFKLRHKKYRRTLFSRPCIYGVFNGPFGGFRPIREKCTGCMRCVQEFPGVCSVDRNEGFYKHADSYWIPDDPSTASGTPAATVLFEAETGKIPIRGMGYKGAFAGPGWDSMWTDMSEIVRPTRDGVYGREYISTLVDLGRKQKLLEFDTEKFNQPSKTVEIALPIVFDYLPSSLNSAHIMESISSAASRTGTMFIATTDQAENLSECLIPLISPNSFERDLEWISKARIIELTQYDPSLLKQVKEINSEAPVSVRLPLSRDSDQIALDLVRDGVDVIHLVADYHGRGWDREDPLFVRDLVRAVHGRLVKESLRDEVTLIASGGITLAEHVPKAIICGADLVAIDTTILVALQAQFQGECRFPETGSITPEKFDAKWGERRLVNLLGSWHDQLIEILSAMGMRDVRRLRGDVGRAMFNEDLEKEAFADIIHRA